MLDEAKIRPKNTINWVQDHILNSCTWEDYACLSSAISNMSQVPKNILSLGGAGDNALSLLIHNPQNLVIAEPSLPQIFLIRLKMAAIEHLDHKSFMELFGYLPCENRDLHYQVLRSHLSVVEQDYWYKNRDLIEEGLAYAGRLDSYFKKFRDRIFKATWGKESFEELVHAKSIEAQIKAWRSGDLKLLSDATHKFFSREAFEEDDKQAPWLKFVEKSKISSSFLLRFERLIRRQLISGNPYLYFFLTGDFNKNLDFEKQFPLLTDKYFLIIRSRLKRVQLLYGDLTSCLNQKPMEYDFINLSFLFEYLNPQERTRYSQRLLEVSSSHAQFAYWSLLVNRNPEFFQENTKLSKQLSSQDRTWFYSKFIIAGKK